MVINKNMRETVAMSRKFFLVTIVVAALSLTACTNTLNDIDEDGGISGDIVYPKMSDATLEEGVFVTKDDLSMVLPGVVKRDLYRSLGRPHFKERNGAREWNYILKFRGEDKKIDSCLLKVVFDKDKVAQRFYWEPENCPIKN